MVEQRQEILLRGLPDLTPVAPQKHVVKCENFQRIIEMMYEKGICKSLDMAKTPCQGFSDGCITPPHFSPRDGFPIERVAFSLEESAASTLKPKDPLIDLTDHPVRPYFVD